MLLVVGALITSYVIPLYSRQWQEELEVQKELELKSELVGQIGEAIGGFLTKTQSVKTILNIPYIEFYDAYHKNWEATNSMVESKLRAYFQGSPLPMTWSNYSVIVSDFARMSIITDICNRLAYVEEIRRFYLTNPEPMNYTGLHECKNNQEALYFQKIDTTPYTSRLDNIDWNELARVRKSNIT